MTTPLPQSSSSILTLLLPGPSRKRVPSPYHFRSIYQNLSGGEPGCMATWEVLGGREEYQISLEKTNDGEFLWHCCCPDSVYREEPHNKHICKHVRGLLEGFESIGAPAFRAITAA